MTNRKEHLYSYSMIWTFISFAITLIGLAIYCHCNPFLWLWRAETFHIVSFLFATAILWAGITEWVKHR